jgi:hypothetical protein
MRHPLLVVIVPLVLCASSSVPGADEKTAKFVARVTATEQGKIEKITLRGDGIKKELDLKADTADFEKKLKELATQYKGKRIKLTIEIADKLLQEHVITLLDVSVRAGIEDVSPVPIDPKKR